MNFFSGLVCGFAVKTILDVFLTPNKVNQESQTSQEEKKHAQVQTTLQHVRSCLTAGADCGGGSHIRREGAECCKTSQDKSTQTPTCISISTQATASPGRDAKFLNQSSARKYRSSSNESKASGSRWKHDRFCMDDNDDSDRTSKYAPGVDFGWGSKPGNGRARRVNGHSQRNRRPL